MTEPEDDTSREPKYKNIVLCSDGTWAKGGSATPTNVWRTYLTVSPEGQAKFHDDGVGTSDFRLGRYIGGAFGWGISANIRQLLMHLAHAYEPGSKIFLFGFSRGAFTVRVIANIITMFGVPKVQASNEKLNELIGRMLKVYKQANIKRSQVAEEKDNAKTLRKILEVDGVADIRKQCHQADEGEFDVHFVGCWDTVEALGVPFESIKRRVNSLFPLRFRDNFPSPKIRHLYQALSLDDERHTFHPIVWRIPKSKADQDNDQNEDETEDTNEDEKAKQTLEQVWFPGCHSHVGGCYAKDQLALIALEWMFEKAEEAGLDLQDDLRNRYRLEATSHGQMVDSRAGMSAFYRYYPRSVSRLQPDGEYNVHASAIKRISSQTESYCPISLDVEEIKIVENKCELKKDKESTRKKSGKSKQSGSGQPDGLPESVPLGDKFHQSRMLIESRYIPLGRLLYRLTIFLAFSFLFLGWFIPFSAIQCRGLLEIGWEWIRIPIYCVAFVEHVIFVSLKYFVPTFIHDSVLVGIEQMKGLLSFYSCVFFGLLLTNRERKRQIKKLAFQAWSHTGLIRRQEETESESGSGNIDQPKKRFWQKVAGWLIWILLPLANLFFRKRPDGFWRRFLTTLVFFVILPGVIFGLSIRAMFNSFFVSVELPVKAIPTSVLTLNESKTFNFHTSQYYCPTGVYVIEGQQFQLREKANSEKANSKKVEVEKWKDKTIPAGPHGIVNPEDEGTIHMMRLKPSLPLFHLMGQIGDNGKLFGLPLNATFTADRDGELKILVNDVRGFYYNNIGSSKFEIVRVDEAPKTD